MLAFNPLEPQKKTSKTYRIRVLILTVSTSYSFLRACLIWRLLDLTLTMKTRVLFSSIFFMALSVFRGYRTILLKSRAGPWLTDTRGYLGDRDSWRVLGRWKVAEVRTLRDL